MNKQSYWLGKHLSEEHKRKVSESRKGIVPWNKGLKGLKIGNPKGVIFTEEHRRNLSKALKGHIPWNKGIPRTEELKKKLSEHHKLFYQTPEGQALRKKISREQKGKIISDAHKEILSVRFSGNGNPGWEGGIGSEPYSIDWNRRLRRQIRNRDNNQCQICRKINFDKKLDVHHIDYNKTNCKENNLITLCKRCHRRTNFNREYWRVILQSHFNKGEDSESGTEVDHGKIHP